MSVFILAASRTPMGALGGSLKALSAPDLAAAVLATLMEGSDPEALGGVLLGQAVQAGAGPNPASIAARRAGIPAGIPAFTVNQGAASGLQAILQAVLSLQAGAGPLFLAGGMESASAAPYLLPTARWGTRMGSAPVLDALLQDGEEAPGASPSAPAEAFARLGQDRALRAREAGLFSSQLTPLTLTSRRGTAQVSEDDPMIGPGATPELRDGAAAVLLSSDPSLALQPPLARIAGSAQGAGAAQAIQRLLETTGLALEAIDRFELLEANPAQLLGLLSAFPALAPARVNVLGGALALGLPLGAAGAQLVASLAHQLRDGGFRYGLAALESQGCGLAMLLERP